MGFGMLSGASDMRNRGRLMSEEIFREKSLEKINSPDDLHDYVKVANPGVWLVIVAVIVLLIGATVWGFFGRVQVTTVNDQQEVVVEQIRPIDFIIK